MEIFCELFNLVVTSSQSPKETLIIARVPDSSVLQSYIVHLIPPNGTAMAFSQESLESAGGDMWIPTQRLFPLATLPSRAMTLGGGCC